MELDQISRIIFQDKNSYQHIDNKEKDKLFFIFNRLFSRGVPNVADLLNRKGIDKSMALDILFEYNKKTTRVPAWFKPNWSKLKTVKSDPILQKFSDTDKFILSHYTDAIEQEKINIESKKLTIIEVIKKKKKKN